MRKRTAAFVVAAAAVLATGVTASPASAFSQYGIAVNIADGLCLDIPNSNPYNGAYVQQWSCNGTDAQKWNVVIETTDGHFEIQSAHWPQYCLNNWFSGDNTGDPIKLYACGTHDDLFNIVGPDSGYVQFQPINASSNCANMWGGQDPGDVMALFPCSDTGSNSQFRLMLDRQGGA